MEVRVFTVRLVAPVTAPLVAAIDVVPPATPRARPAALIVATAGVVEAHVTPVVRAAVVPSLYVPVAVYC
jgi:hypothetical protein